MIIIILQFGWTGPINKLNQTCKYECIPVVCVERLDEKWERSFSYNMQLLHIQINKQTNRMHNNIISLCIVARFPPHTWVQGGGGNS